MANANRENNYKRNANNVNRADIIIKTDAEISAKVDRLSAEVLKTGSRLDDALAQLGKVREDNAYSSRQLTEVYEALRGEYESLRRELKFIAVQSENIFSELSKRLAENQQGYQYPRHTGYYQPVPQPVQVKPEIDYDLLARKIADLLPVQEQISADYIACKVAEQIVIPDAPAAVAQPAVYQDAPAPVQYAPVPVDLQLDEEELADRIALKVGSIKPQDFDILVDDDGCSSISDDIVKKLNYEYISSAVAQKLGEKMDGVAGMESDYEEMAARISEKVTVAGINEEAIADKAAAALSNYLPEIDTDEIADKVAGQILDGMPAVDSDAICKNISEKLIESQESHDYDIVLDEDGIGKLTEYVSGEVLKRTDERFDSVDKDIAEIKAMLTSGLVIREAAASEAQAYEEPYVSEESTLVTVSEIIDDAADDEQLAESEESGEQTEEVEEAETEEEEDVLSQLVNEIDEVPSEGEIMPDGLDGTSDGVDFENMMKYNRSFIARIIQSSDDYKQYYGQVKTALLSYAKVNSNIAWGAERFNKGRETIARFKIRGKTLCLYLALDPNDYEYSVYHHVDVSDNKSMHGTPMMVKIKSPRGAKKAIRLIDELLAKRGGVKRNRVIERDYAAMYPYESIEELIEDGLVKDVSKSK